MIPGGTEGDARIEQKQAIRDDDRRSARRSGRLSHTGSIKLDGTDESTREKPRGNANDKRNFDSGGETYEELRIQRQPRDSVLAWGKWAISAGRVHIENRAIKGKGVEVRDRSSPRMEGPDQQGPVDRWRKPERLIGYRPGRVVENPGLRKGAGVREND